jgi:hypothetical protein
MAGEIHIIDIVKSAHRTMFITHDPSPLAVLCEEKKRRNTPLLCQICSRIAKSLLLFNWQRT